MCHCSTYCMCILFFFFKEPEPKIIRRISQPKPLIEPDEPTAAGRSPSPPRKPVSNIIHIRNLTRPFTLNQLKELLKRTGSLVEESFWIDNIKSHCIVTVSSLLWLCLYVCLGTSILFVRGGEMKLYKAVLHFCPIMIILLRWSCGGCSNLLVC